MVGLETSVVGQGLPVPQNADAARRMCEAISSAGATPAFTAIVAGEPAAGLTPSELDRFLRRDGVAKASSRDLPLAIARGGDAATTVAGALWLCRLAGIPVLATGGIGGVHRGGDGAHDESADLLELSRSPLVVVCSGAKSLLDLPATVERLETLGVTVVGYRTAAFPGFHFADTGLPVSATVDTPAEVVAIFRAQRRLELPGALLLVQPPPVADALTRDEVEASVALALDEASRAGVRGPATTPFLLASIDRHTSGRSLRANLALLEANALLAATVASALHSHEWVRPNGRTE